MKSSARKAMPSAKELTGKELGKQLAQAMRDINAGKIGRITEVEVNPVTQARHRTGLSQAEFAHALQISRRTLQEWEQGRRNPSGPAQALIRIAQAHPKVVKALVS